LANKRIALWGLSFKPETDDMREATSLILIDNLLNLGSEVVVYDPVAMHECRRRIGDKVIYADNMYEAVEGADALLLVTEWKEFRLPDWKLLKQTMKQSVIIDGRNIYNRIEVRKHGFVYECIGCR